MGTLFVCVGLLFMVPPPAAAQSICSEDPLPPCYRVSESEPCDATCQCGSPTYPACDSQCVLGQECDPDCGDNSCWSSEGRDLCVSPPAACAPGQRLEPAAVDGDEWVRWHDCVRIEVPTTGYYRLYADPLADTCLAQSNETSIITAPNGCNPKGWPEERNAADTYAVLDRDNVNWCVDDAECPPDHHCYAWEPTTRCCVPNEPAFMGTFLLVAGESQELCIEDICTELGDSHGFVVPHVDRRGNSRPPCTNGSQSVGIFLETLFACEDTNGVHACAGGCALGVCEPDPCEDMDCPAFCQDGECVDTTPCEARCGGRGCRHGKCLQGRWARGEDADGDGYSVLADCDDTRPEIHPGCAEVCDNGLDDDCDGVADEGCERGGCETPTDEICGNGLDDDCDGLVDEGCGPVEDYHLRGSVGCECSAGTRPDTVPRPGAAALLLILWAARRLRRHGC